MLRGGPKRKHAYVGMTNQPPERRLKQHNGLMRGGAVATKKHRGTWELHLVVSGLASKTAALVLEHAVQHPTTPPASLFAARHLKGVLPWCDQFAAVRVRCKDIKKKNFASSVEYRERVIKELLQMDLWRALTLKHHGAAAAPAALAFLGRLTARRRLRRRRRSRCRATCTWTPTRRRPPRTSGWRARARGPYTGRRGMQCGMPNSTAYGYACSIKRRSARRAKPPLHGAQRHAVQHAQQHGGISAACPTARRTGTRALQSGAPRAAQRRPYTGRRGMQCSMPNSTAYQHACSIVFGGRLCG